MAFMELVKNYRVDRSALWKLLEIYGLGGRLLEAVGSFYQKSMGNRKSLVVPQDDGSATGVCDGNTTVICQWMVW